MSYPPLAGEIVPVALTPPYAAPEVVAAYQQQQATIEASAAVDIWAFGVMAYELLTRTVWFEGLSQEEMLAAVATQGQLPWERTAPEARRTLRRSLRALAPHVMSCLQRDPTRRPTAAQLATKLDSLYTATTSKTSTCQVEVRAESMSVCVAGCAVWHQCPCELCASSALARLSPMRGIRRLPRTQPPPQRSF